MQKVTQRFIKNFDAIDITNWSFNQLQELYRNTLLDRVYISIGTYGMNGGILKDNKGNFYKITARNSALFQMF